MKRQIKLLRDQQSNQELTNEVIQRYRQSLRTIISFIEENEKHNTKRAFLPNNRNNYTVIGRIVDEENQILDSKKKKKLYILHLKLQSVEQITRSKQEFIVKIVLKKNNRKMLSRYLMMNRENQVIFDRIALIIINRDGKFIFEVNDESFVMLQQPLSRIDGRIVPIVEEFNRNYAFKNKSMESEPNINQKIQPNPENSNKESQIQFQHVSDMNCWNIKRYLKNSVYSTQVNFDILVTNIKEIEREIQRTEGIIVSASLNTKFQQASNEDERHFDIASLTLSDPRDESAETINIRMSYEPEQFMVVAQLFQPNRRVRFGYLRKELNNDAEIVYKCIFDAKEITVVDDKDYEEHLTKKQHITFFNTIKYATLINVAKDEFFIDRRMMKFRCFLIKPIFLNFSNICQSCQLQVLRSEVCYNCQGQPKLQSRSICIVQDDYCSSPAQLILNDKQCLDFYDIEGTDLERVVNQTKQDGNFNVSKRIDSKDLGDLYELIYQRIVYQIIIGRPYCDFFRNRKENLTMNSTKLEYFHDNKFLFNQQNVFINGTYSQELAMGNFGKPIQLPCFRVIRVFNPNVFNDNVARSNALISEFQTLQNLRELKK